MTEYEKTIERAADAVRAKINALPEAALILGSGLGDAASRVEDAVRIPYRDVPGMPLPSVSGHGGQIIIGRLCGRTVAVLDGRVHYYEGYSQREVAFPVRVTSRLGVKTLIITNAAGGINTSFKPGTLMLISDHINMSGGNPLIGENLDSFGPRFPDMSAVYTPELRARLKEAAKEEGIELAEGVYVMYSGPNYETPAEIRFFRTIGGDAVGMSTVPEAIAAAHCGMRVVGISCITNMAAGTSDRRLSHAEVLESAAMVSEKLGRLVEIAIRRL